MSLLGKVPVSFEIFQVHHDLVIEVQVIELGLNVRLLGEQMLQLGVFFVAGEDEVDANRRFGFREGVIVLDCLQGITHIY